MTASYHNTTGEHGEQLELYEVIASKQDREVLRFFRIHSGGHTPSEVHRSFQTAPLTSVRRAITNLTKRRLLWKTKEKRIGPYGRPEHVWVLLRDQ